jgi:hypothetical protein
VEPDLERQAVQPEMAMPLGEGAGAGAAPEPGAERLDQHDHADRAEEHDVAERDHDVDLAALAQQLEQPDAAGRANEAAGDQDHAHAQVDIAAAHMGQHARGRRRQNLGCLGADRNRRRDPDEDQERRHQETAPDAKNTRQKTDGPAQAEQ